MVLRQPNKWLVRGLMLTVVLCIGFVLLTLPKPNKNPLDLTPAKPQYPYLVYFCKTTGAQITVEGVSMAAAEDATLIDVERLEKAIKTLLAGPTAAQKKKGYYSEIPAGTQLLDIEVKPELIRLNLSGDFGGDGGSASMLYRYHQLQNTVLSTHIDTPIYLDMDGEPVEVLGGEGLEVDTPLNKAVEKQ